MPVPSALMQASMPLREVQPNTRDLGRLRL
jgi:hypothetical protein